MRNRNPPALRAWQTCVSCKRFTNRHKRGEPWRCQGYPSGKDLRWTRRSIARPISDRERFPQNPLPARRPRNRHAPAGFYAAFFLPVAVFRSWRASCGPVWPRIVNPTLGRTFFCLDDFLLLWLPGSELAIKWLLRNAFRITWTHPDCHARGGTRATGKKRPASCRTASKRAARRLRVIRSKAGMQSYVKEFVTGQCENLSEMLEKGLPTPEFAVRICCWLERQSYQRLTRCNNSATILT